MSNDLPFDEKMVLGDYDHWFRVSYHHHSRPYLLLLTTLEDKWMTLVEAYLKAFP